MKLGDIRVSKMDRVRRVQRKLTDLSGFAPPSVLCPVLPAAIRSREAVVGKLVIIAAYFRKPVSRLRPSDIRGFVRSMERRRLSPITIVTYLQCVKGLLLRAQRMGLCDSTTLSSFKAVRNTPTRAQRVGSILRKLIGDAYTPEQLAVLRSRLSRTERRWVDSVYLGRNSRSFECSIVFNRIRERIRWAGLPAGLPHLRLVKGLKASRVLHGLITQHLGGTTWAQ